MIHVKSETGITNDRCYLNGFGDCSTKLTKEHFVSRNILQRIATPTIKIDNAPPHFFGGKQSVQFGVDAFSAKVLCDRHNSALSPLDDAAGKAFSAIEALTAALLRNANDPGKRIKTFHVVSGLDLERWLIKVYCGLVAAGKIRAISGRIATRNELDPFVLGSVLGAVSLCPPLGFYHHAFTGQQTMGSTISFSTIQITDGSDEIGGLNLALGMLNLVLVVSSRFGESFTEPNWFRHPTLAWNVKHGKSKLGYLFTY